MSALDDAREHFERGLTDLADGDVFNAADHIGQGLDICASTIVDADERVEFVRSVLEAGRG